MPSFVMAAWSSGVTGPTAALAATVNAGGTPTASASGRTVALSWSPSTLSNGTPVTGYVVARYDAAGGVQQTIASGSCASTVATTSCSETAAPPGTWTYSVTPVRSNWRGS
jgi:hypothetical protein